MIRLRLSDFCSLIAEEREGFRAVLARGHAPFDPTPPEGQRQRSYDGADLIAWLLFHRLRARGLSAAAAGAAVRLSRAVAEFSAADESERSELCLLWGVERRRRTVPYPSEIEMIHQSTGGPEMLTHLLSRPLGSEVRPLLHPQEPPQLFLGFDILVFVPIAPAHAEARARLAPLGLDLIGAEIVETAK